MRCFPACCCSGRGRLRRARRALPGPRVPAGVVLLRSAEDARDVSQEAFLRVYRTAGSFRGDARFSTWFYRVLVNLCLDHRRRGRWWHRLLVRDDGTGDPERAVLERQPAPVADPGDALGRQQVMARLWAAVDRLSPQQRATILLHVQEELPTSQIAEVLKCSEATVRAFALGGGRPPQDRDPGLRRCTPRPSSPRM